MILENGEIKIKSELQLAVLYQCGTVYFYEDPWFCKMVLDGEAGVVTQEHSILEC